MFKFAVFVSLISFSLCAPFSGPECIKDRTAQWKKLLPDGYIKQIEKLMSCPKPKVYQDCYENNVSKLPKDFDGLISMTCTPPNIDSYRKFNQCVMTSMTKAVDAVRELGDNIGCELNVLAQRQPGFLCDQWKKDKDKAAEFAKGADGWFSQTNRAITDAAPQDIKSCAGMLPKKSGDLIDLICDDARDTQGTKIIKCFSDNLTVRSVMEIVSKIQPRFG